jgi:hypothetical protein
VKTGADLKELWICPKCKRQFERKGQIHSCRSFPLYQHFERKPKGNLLYEKFKLEVQKRLGPIQVESLKCCIHLVGQFTFAAVKIFKDKIKIDFTLTRKIDHQRFVSGFQMSAHRYVYYIDIKQEEEIDQQLLDWVQEAYEKKGKGSL